MSILGDSVGQSHGWNDVLFAIVTLLSQGGRRHLHRPLLANIFRLHRSSNKNSYYCSLHFWLTDLLMLGGEGNEMHSSAGYIAVGRKKIIS